ncbi:hypothetical protein BH23VER1_BH23VER1_00050 [soil metagenome]
MVFEENRAFSADAYGVVKPLSDHYVAVTLDYWQIFWGENSTRPGRFLSRYGLEGIDTAGQVVLSPSGEMLAAHRSWKTGNGFGPDELAGFASLHPADPEQKDRLRLSWFLIDPAYFEVDLGKEDTGRYTSEVGALTGARKIRRPLVRVEGAALDWLEENQEFLARHVRQFWWQKGSRDKPARLIVLDGHDTPPGEEPTELTVSCPPGKVPAVLAAIDLGDGVDLERVSPILDRAWSDYMAGRPSNADNLTFAKENIPKFKEVDEAVRRLARDGRILAPGGRELFR